ncbi:CD166 antigen homolog [Corythoichthys intestinalis]|uniref:CD166 antigen homolog n=1 Tax=Corythoichthys intestinalis TaxID=161448 RepID=UPI0025A64845|nr:CD166 antigen homolog [Corythoichthys intestinalis]
MQMAGRTGPAEAMGKPERERSFFWEFQTLLQLRSYSQGGQNGSRLQMALPQHLDESPFINDKVVQKMTIVPTLNLTVRCTVYNEFGMDTWYITVSPHQSEDVAQTQLVIGVVAGLVISSVVIGLAYGICKGISKQGSRNRAENENGPSFEETNMDTNQNPEE